MNNGVSFSSTNSDNCPEYPHVSQPILLLFCVYVLVWYLQIGSRISWLGAIRIELLIACLLIPLGIVTHQKFGTSVKSPLIPLIIIYFLLLFVMTLFSYDFETSWNVFFNRVIKFAFMAFFIVSFVRSPKAMKLFIATFMLACFKMGQEGLVGQITGGLVWQNQGVMRLHGATMMYRHPNSFSGMALGTLPFILYLFPIVNKWAKVFLLVQLIFSLNIILHTGSRTGYVALIGMVFIWFIKSRHKVRILFILLVGIVVLIRFIPDEYVERFRSIYTSSETTYSSSVADNWLDERSMEALHGGDSSKEARIQILKDAVEIFLKHPFGVGVGAFPSVRHEVFGRDQDTHNLYLEVLTNLGIQGFVIFSLLLYYMLATLFVMRNSLKDNIYKLDDFDLKTIDISLADNICYHVNDMRFLMAICDSVILFICVRLLLGMFGMDLYEIYWWFSLGITLSVMNILQIIIGKTKYFLSL